MSLTLDVTDSVGVSERVVSSTGATYPAVLFKDPFTTGGFDAGWTSASGGSGNAGRNGNGHLVNSTTHMVKTVTGTDKSDVFTVGIAVYSGAGFTDDSDGDDFGLMSFCSDAGVTCHIYIGWASNALRVYRGQRGTVLGTSATAMTSSVWHYVTAQVVLHDTAGSVKVIQDGATVLDLTGIDTKNGGTDTQFDTVKVGGFWPTNFPVDDFYLASGAGPIRPDPGDVTSLSLGASAAGLAHTLGVADNAGASDAANATVEANSYTFSDSLGPTDAAGLEPGKTDSVGLTDTVSYLTSNLAFGQNDRAGTTDSRALLVEPTRRDNLGVTDSIFATGSSVDGSQVAQDRLALTDSISRAVTVSRNDNAVPRDSIATDIVPEGELFANPIVISGSGTRVFSTLGSSRETDEPADEFGNNTAGTIWFSYTPTGPGSLALSTSGAPTWNAVIEVYEGTALVDLDVSASGAGTPATVNVAVAQGTTYKIRLHANTSAGETASASLAYTFTARAQEFNLDVLSDLPSSPGTVKVTVGNGVAGEAVTFNLVGYGSNPLLSTVLDGTGSLVGISVPIPAGQAAGAYTLQAVTPSFTDTDTFQILANPPARPTTLPADAPPVAVPRTGVQRWVIQDPAPGGATYIFPNNPERMSSPHPPRTITAETTVGPAGQPLLWEGAERAHEWTFAGYCGTQEFHDTLAYYTAIPRRFYLIDHRNRAWTVSFENFDISPRRDLGNDWGQNYTMTAIVYAGPVQL